MLRPFQPYFEKFARIDVQSGAVNLDGTMHLAIEHPNGPLLSYEGTAGVEAVSVADRDQGEEVASLQALSLNGVRVTVDPTTASIKEVSLQQPMAHLVVQPDGGLNLGKLAATPPSAASADEKPAEGNPKPLTVEEMRQQLVAAIPVPDSDLRLLAQQRAEQMRGQLAEDGKLADECLFLTEVDLTASDYEKVRSRLNITAGE